MFQRDRFKRPITKSLNSGWKWNVAKSDNLGFRDRNYELCAWTKKTLGRLLHKGKYHSMTDLLFDWLGFSCFAYVELDRALQVWSNPNQSNRGSAVQ